MAAEIDHRPHLDHQKSNLNSGPELSFDSVQLQLESQAISISEILDHGSVSFGRYASEPLAWEKWSVFPHNRCQEELEKFKNPGLVAQKKAYFEEYYKKIRAMKGLPELEEEISEPASCQDAQNSNTPVKNNGTSTVSKDKKNDHQTLISGNDTISLEDRTCTSPSAVKEKHPTKKASLSQVPSSASLKLSQQKSLVSNTVNHKSNQPKKNVPGLQAKGTFACVRSKTKLERSGTIQNAIKQSEKSNPLLRKITHKSDNSLLPSKKTDPTAASNINKQVIKFRTTTTVPNSSLARNKLTASTSIARDQHIKPSTTSDGLSGKLSRKPSVHDQSAKLVSSSVSKRAPQLKPRSNSQHLVAKLSTKLPVNSQSSKSISKDITATSGLINTVKRSANLSAIRKSSEKIGPGLGQRSRVEGVKWKKGKEKLSAEHGREPKVFSSAGTQKEQLRLGNGKLSLRTGRDPKTVSSTGPRKEKTSSRLGRDPKAATSAGPGKEKLRSRPGRDLKAESSSGLIRNKKPASSMLLNSHKAPNARPVNKTAPRRSVDEKCDQGNQGRGSPIPKWR